MKKTLIASAVAAATLSSTAFAMDQATELAKMLESMPTFYGNIQLANVTADYDGSVGAASYSDSDSSFIDNGSTLGIKHSHMISDGLTAYALAEFEFAADDKTQSTGLSTLDEAYIGLKGDFGDVRIGSDESVYQWIDVVDMFEATGISGGIGDNPQGDSLNYVSPEVAEGLKLGLTVPLDTDASDLYSGTLAGMYEIDNMGFGLAYSAGRGDNEDAIGLMGTIGLDDLSLALQYETVDKDKDYMAFLAQYSMGANNFALGYAVTSYDAAGAEDTSELYLQALHSLSDNMYVYVEYKMATDASADIDGDGTSEFAGDIDTFALGAAYAF